MQSENMHLKAESPRRTLFLKGAFFLVLGLLLLAILSMLTKHILIKTVYNPALVTIPNDIETIMLGSSDMQFGLNPDIIANSINVSRPAENLFYVYYKLKFLLMSNNRIKNVVLGFSSYDFSKNRERDLYKSQYNKIYFLLLDKYGVNTVYKPTKDYWFFYSKYCMGLPIEIQKELSILLNIILNKNSIYDYSFCGVFKKHKGTKSLNADMYYRNGFLNNERKICQPSELMIESMKKIALLCKQKGVTLSLISAPVHKSFSSLIPTDYEHRTLKIIQTLTKTNANIRYYNYSQWELNDDCFYDAAHLNSKGSDIFSLEVNNLLDRLVH